MLTSNGMLYILLQLKLAKNSAIKIESQEERHMNRDNQSTRNQSHNILISWINPNKHKPSFGFILLHNLFLCKNLTKA